MTVPPIPEDDTPWLAIDGHSMWYDKQGVPAGMQTFAAITSDWRNTVIGRTSYLGYDVRTDFLGMDTTLGKSDIPLIYETMIFGPKGPEVIARYATELEAYYGHWLTSVLLLAIVTSAYGLAASRAQCECCEWKDDE